MARPVRIPAVLSAALFLAMLSSAVEAGGGRRPAGIGAECGAAAAAPARTAVARSIRAGSGKPTYKWDPRL